MRGVGVVFSRFLEVSIEMGVVIGMIIVLFYAVLGGMKGITYTQVAQYCVLIFAYMVPAIFISCRPCAVLLYAHNIATTYRKIFFISISLWFGKGVGYSKIKIINLLNQIISFPWTDPGSYSIIGFI